MVNLPNYHNLICLVNVLPTLFFKVLILWAELLTLLEALMSFENKNSTAI